MFNSQTSRDPYRDHSVPRRRRAFECAGSPDEDSRPPCPADERAHVPVGAVCARPRGDPPQFGAEPAVRCRNRAGLGGAGGPRGAAGFARLERHVPRATASTSRPTCRISPSASSAPTAATCSRSRRPVPSPSRSSRCSSRPAGRAAACCASTRCCSTRRCSRRLRRQPGSRSPRRAQRRPSCRPRRPAARSGAAPEAAPAPARPRPSRPTAAVAAEPGATYRGAAERHVVEDRERGLPRRTLRRQSRDGRDLPGESVCLRRQHQCVARRQRTAHAVEWRRLVDLRVRGSGRGRAPVPTLEGRCCSGAPRPPTVGRLRLVTPEQGSAAPSTATAAAPAAATGSTDAMQTRVQQLEAGTRRGASPARGAQRRAGDAAGRCRGTGPARGAGRRCCACGSPTATAPTGRGSACDRRDPQPEPEAPPSPSRRPKPEPQRDATAAEPQPTLFDRLREYWWTLLGLLARGAGHCLAFLRNRRASGSVEADLEDALGRKADDLRTRQRPRRRRGIILRRRGAQAVEPVATLATPAVAAGRRRPSRRASRSPSRTRCRAKGPVSIEAGDPLAEADFHMAYGLYDQAADLVQVAVEARAAAPRPQAQAARDLLRLGQSRPLPRGGARDECDAQGRATGRVGQDPDHGPPARVRTIRCSRARRPATVTAEPRHGAARPPTRRSTWSCRHWAPSARPDLDLSVREKRVVRAGGRTRLHARRAGARCGRGCVAWRPPSRRRGSRQQPPKNRPPRCRSRTSGSTGGSRGSTLAGLGRPGREDRTVADDTGSVPASPPVVDDTVERPGTGRRRRRHGGASRSIAVQWQTRWNDQHPCRELDDTVERTGIARREEGEEDLLSSTSVMGSDTIAAMIGEQQPGMIELSDATGACRPSR